MQPESLDARVETPIDDAVEQARSADPSDGVDDLDQVAEVHRGMEVGEWDAAEQSRTVDLTDDYR